MNPLSGSTVMKSPTLKFGSCLSYIRTNSGKHLRGVMYAGIVRTTNTIPKPCIRKRIYIIILSAYVYNIYIYTYADLETPLNRREKSALQK